MVMVMINIYGHMINLTQIRIKVLNGFMKYGMNDTETHFIKFSEYINKITEYPLHRL